MASPDDALLTPARWIGKRCTVAQALLEIADPKQLAKVTVAADDERVPSKNLEKYLRDLIGDRPGKGNASPGHTTIRRHQLRECECPAP